MKIGGPGWRLSLGAQGVDNFEGFREFWGILRILGGLGVLGDFEDLGGYEILRVLGNFGQFRDVGI